jgi:CheY-like chemotaxis protein
MTFPERVLLVTDGSDSDVFKHCNGLLESELVPVTGDDSLAAAMGAGNFDLVLSKQKLSWGDGLDAVRRLKARFPTKPAVVLAASPEIQDVVAAMKAGADDYVFFSDGSEGRLAAVIGALGERANERGPSSPVEAHLYEEARQRAN